MVDVCSGISRVNIFLLDFAEVFRINFKLYLNSHTLVVNTEKLLKSLLIAFLRFLGLHTLVNSDPNIRQKILLKEFQDNFL